MSAALWSRLTGSIVLTEDFLGGSRYMALDHPPPSSHRLRGEMARGETKIERFSSRANASEITLQASASSLLLPVRHLSGCKRMPIVEAGTPGTPLNVDSTVRKDAAATPAPAPSAGQRQVAVPHWGAGALEGSRSLASAHLTLVQNDMVARLCLRLK
ncbi:unnamed protein product [Pleuronectes platessa]|uniref:Uncharacterized protein n=1 Tax=Pleuronectes platessa TaxID=8262 RepID=A0A9N7VZ51_PLEPL|nr:unnamed protein product [Pleuronectes platessa]